MPLRAGRVAVGLLLRDGDKVEEGRSNKKHGGTCRYDAGVIDQKDNKAAGEPCIKACLEITVFAEKLFEQSRGLVED